MLKPLSEEAIKAIRLHTEMPDYTGVLEMVEFAQAVGVNVAQASQIDTVRQIVEWGEREGEHCDSAGDNFTGIGQFISEDDWQELKKESEK